MKEPMKMIVYGILFFLFSASSCRKFLDEKENKAKVIPQSLEDVQALLDNYTLMNFRYAFTGLPARVGDEYYLLSSYWASLSNIDDRLNYVWDRNATSKNEYDGLYQPVYYANNALDILSSLNMNKNNSSEYNNIRGQALFHRSFAFYHLAQLYCKPYDLSTASNEPGIALRLKPDIEEKSIRSTVQQTYDRIITDLKEAASLLPSVPYSLSYWIMRPGKAAAYGALARTYLSMRDYKNARIYSDSCLGIYNILVDYNSLNANLPTPFTKTNNAENIFVAQCAFAAGINDYLIDTTLYQSYASKDLRKAVYFQQVTNGYIFKGGYFGEFGSSCGLATDEMYLTRAECAARAGDISAAMTDLNILMVKRWKNDGSFITITATNTTDALNKILTERRKELIYRGTRWMDLRRFNMEGANITLKRVINGDNYTLPPNDLRWVMLFPPDVINLTGMQQNAR
jgi:starch-binding outer membrane protein, SusD/RagB family